MALSRKGLRKITVGQYQYYWRTYGTDYGIALTVVISSFKGQKLFAAFGYEAHQRHTPHGNAYYYRQRMVVTPFIVRATILKALEKGWQPTQPRPEFYARFERHELPIDNQIHRIESQALPLSDLPRKLH